MVDILHRVGITLNKNLIPFDPAPPRVTSGVRIGTPAVTTRGFRRAEIEIVADCIHKALRHPDDKGVQQQIRETAYDLCMRFPVPGLCL